MGDFLVVLLYLLLCHFCFVQSKVCNIVDYGAVGDNSTINTKAIQKALDDCANGGTVLIPAPGTFITGSLFLRSNEELFISSGAEIRGVFQDWSTTWTHYPRMYTRTNSYMMHSHASLLNAGYCLQMSSTPSALGDQCVQWQRVANVTIRGGGTINGNGEPWWSCFYTTNQTCPDGTLAESQRPSALALLWVKGLYLGDITVRDSGFWSVHPVFCDDVVIERLRIEAPEDAPNTDGIDPDSCHNVTIRDIFISVGDDCIAVSSGKDLDGRLVNISSTDITVTNVTCLSGHGLSVGSGTSGNISRVTFRDCFMRGTQYGPRVKSMRGRGGVVEDILYDGITVDSITRSVIEVTMYYKQGIAPTNASATPIFRNIMVRNVKAPLRTNLAAGDLLGLPESVVQNLTLDNVFIQAFNGFKCSEVQATQNNVFPPLAC